MVLQALFSSRSKAATQPVPTEQQLRDAALAEAAGQGKLEIVQSLVTQGADICYRPPGSLSSWPSAALCNAASGGHLETVTFLIDKFPFDKFNTAAAAGGYKQVTKQDLLDTALLKAAGRLQCQLVKDLIALGANANCRANWIGSETPLIAAVRTFYMPTHTAQSNTALRKAEDAEFINKTTAMIDILLNAGARINDVETHDGHSALMVAAQRFDDPAVVLHLLRRGADYTIREPANIHPQRRHSALDIARSWGHTAVVKAIEEFIGSSTNINTMRLYRRRDIDQLNDH